MSGMAWQCIQIRWLVVLLTLGWAHGPLEAEEVAQAISPPSATAAHSSAVERPVLLFGTRLLDGEMRSMRAEESWQVVVFWSVGCEACLDGLRALGPALRELMSRGVSLATIAIDPEEDWPEAAIWLRRLVLPARTAFAIAPDAMAAAIDPRLDVDLEHLLALFLFAPNGTIAGSTRSMKPSPSRLLEQLEALLPPEAIGSRRTTEEDHPLDAHVRNAWNVETTLRDSFVEQPIAGDAGVHQLAGPLEGLCKPYEARGDSPRSAICHEVVGAVFASRHDWMAARECIAASHRAYAAADDVFGRWSTLLSLGFVAAGREHPRAALPIFERALTEVALMRSGKTSFRAELFFDFSQKVGIPADWLPRLERYGGALPAVFADAAETITYTARGKILARLGETSRARSELGRAIASSAGFEGLFQALPRVELGRLEGAAGRFGVARAWFEEALDGPLPRVAWFPWFPDVSRRAIFGLVQEAAITAGETEQALRINERAREAARLADDRTWLAWELTNRSSMLSGNLGRHDQARAALEEAARWAPKADACIQARIHYGLARQDIFTGRLASAQRGVASALEAQAGCPDAVQRLRILRLGSRVCQELGDEACARQRRDEVVRAAEASGDSNQILLARVLDAQREVREGRIGDGFEAIERMVESAADPMVRGLARTIEALRSDIETADDFSVADFMPLEEWLRQEEQRAEELEAFPPQLAFDAVLAGFRAFRQRRFAFAEAAFRVAANRLRATGNADGEALIHGVRGLALWGLDRHTEAVASFERSVDLMESLAGDARTDDQLASILGSIRQDVYTRLIEGLIITGEPQAAFRYSEMARARAFLLQLGGTSSQEEGGAFGARDERESTLEIARLRASITARQLSLDDESMATVRIRIKQQLDHARSALDALVARQKLLSSTVPFAAETLDVATLQARVLDEQTTLLSFFFVPGHLIVWVIDRETVRARLIPWSEEDDERVSCMGSRLARASPRGSAPAHGCGDVALASEALWTKIVAPLNPLIEHREVIVVPHGVLHGLPFAALRDPENDRYWIEDVRLSYAPSASALGRQSSERMIIGHRALVLAAAPDPRDPLPAAEIEARAVAETLGTVADVGSSATEAIVRRTADAIDVLHLAAHGRFDQADARSSRIELMPGGGQDGRLEVRELLDELRFPTLDLVVLSACQTALGDRTRGDDIIGLVRAFMAAGAPTVIATLWPVDDRASADLMVAFYDHLLAGQPVAEALRQAQLALLMDDTTRDPYYWAAFGLYGVPASRYPG